MTKFYTYVLQSEKDKKFYVGFTTNIVERLDTHNAGKVTSTKNRLPMKIVYWEGCLRREDATKRGKYLKSSWGKRYIKNRIKYYLTG
jgi:putative endonuclease